MNREKNIARFEAEMSKVNRAGAAAGADTEFLFRDGFPSTENTKKYPARNVSVIRCRLARSL